ncbi:MAG: hypothetical protein U9Q20_05015 [Campylobacterota bacterium]|nr:hypothetical protein [Campylobacterota bacterium]
MKFILMAIFIVGLFSACQKKDKELVIYANNWIGYTPLLYLQNSGKLKELNIKVSITNSLEDSLNKYTNDSQNSLFCGTQYEFLQASKSTSDLTTIQVFDKSDGGDVVLSNKSMYELSHCKEPIDVYLEENSINSLVFKDFIDLNNLKNHQFNLKNSSQDIIKDLELLKKPSLLITYNPYDIKLIQRGYQLLDSTKNLNICVVDGLFIDKSLLETNPNRLKKLSKKIKEAIITLKLDSKKYYQYIKKDIDNTSYEQFLESLATIHFINNDMSAQFKERLLSTNIDMEGCDNAK